MFPAIQVVILAGPRAVRPELHAWSSQLFDHHTIRHDDWPRDAIAVRRNRLVQWFLDETDRAWLWSIDDDMIPVGPEAARQLGTAPTIALAESDAEVAWCRAVGRDGRLAHRGSYSAACCKLSRRLLERMARPWFAFELKADGLDVASCECAGFAASARAAGASIEAVGIVAHAGIGAVAPDADGRPVVRFGEQWGT